KLRNGVHLLVEIKGGGGKVFDPDAVRAKSAALKKWCSAVTNVGTYGLWEYSFCDAKDADHLKEVLRKTLADHGDGSASVPYTIIEQGKGKPGEDCIPVISLRTICSIPTSEKESDLFFGTLGSELATWPEHPPFEKDMFLSKVFGNAMCPTIPVNTYCV